MLGESSRYLFASHNNNTRAQCIFAMNSNDSENNSRLFAAKLSDSKHPSQLNLFIIAVVLISNGNFIFTARDVCDKNFYCQRQVLG